jgi:cystathionine beta-synthase
MIVDDHEVVREGLRLSLSRAPHIRVVGEAADGLADALLVAYNRMRASDVSQLPVLKDGRIVGILDESDILTHVEGHDEFRAQQFKDPVRTAMTARLKTVQVADKMDVLPPIFERNEVAIVLDRDRFVGLITRIDLINHLRLNP